MIASSMKKSTRVSVMERSISASGDGEIFRAGAKGNRILGARNSVNVVRTTVKRAGVSARNIQQLAISWALAGSLLDACLLIGSPVR